MRILSCSSNHNGLRRSLPQVEAHQAPKTPPPDQPQPGGGGSSVLKSTLVGAAYGALVGAGTALLYQNNSLQSATAFHMTGIAAGGVAGAGILGKAMQPKVEAPASYALGALVGAGVTWGTSAFGLLHSPIIGAVAGGALGAFYGAIGAAIHGY